MTDTTGRPVRSRVQVLLASLLLVMVAAVAVPAPAAAENRFLAVLPNGMPVRWAPNRSVRYVLNLNGREADRLQVVQALAVVSRATGIGFQYVGDTYEVPTRSRPAAPGVWSMRDRSGPYDLIIALASSRQSDMVGGGRRALTTQVWSDQYLHASVVLDREVLGDGWGIGSFGSVMLHEFGHVMGLDHSQSPQNLMYPTDGATASFSAEDWDGLHRLGNGRGAPFDPAAQPGAVTAPAPAAPNPAATPPTVQPVPAPTPATSSASVPPASEPPVPPTVAQERSQVAPSAPPHDPDAFEAMMAGR